MNLVTEAKALQDQLVALRREFHQIPEFGLTLPKTLARLVEEVGDLGELRTEPEISSATVLIRGSEPGPTVLLRADMDALAVVEDTGLSFASTNGYMHACGHDLHIAIGIGAAKLVHAHRDSMKGNVLMFFQSGEEGHGGADEMIARDMHLADGQLPIAAYGLHVFSREKSGRFETKAGPMMASAGDMIVTFKGRAGHGSMPYLSKDPITPMLHAMEAIQTVVTKAYDQFDPVIVNIGWVKAGDPHTTNVIPEVAQFGATIRTFSQTTHHRIRNDLKQLMDGTAAAFGVDVEVAFSNASKVVMNDAKAVAHVEKTVTEMFGAERFETMPFPIPGGEDFSSIIELIPGAFTFLSAGHPDIPLDQQQGNHSNKAVFDEAVLSDGAALLAQLALDLLA